MTGQATGSAAIGAFFYVPVVAPPPPVAPAVTPFAICVYDQTAALTGCVAQTFMAAGCFTAAIALHARHAPVFDTAGIHDDRYTATVPFPVQE